jgi:lysophospholipid acyltransferase (LPLAT)-like uncharacterized protein
MSESAPPQLEPAASESPSALYDVRLPQLSRWQRAQIPIYGWLGYALVRSLGPTLRYELLGWQHVQRIYDAGERFVNAFWHRSIFSAMWWWRDRGVVVLNTTNFDGQWTRRVIERLGFLTAQGSSTRGGMRGLVIMAERLAEGRDVSFTIDGPRGPRYVAKPGPVILARRTGCPIMVFHIGLDRAYTFEKAWDLFQIPYPFSRAVMVIAPAIRVPADAGRETLQEKHAEMQKALERVRDLAESWFSLSEADRARIRAEWNAG